MANEVIKGFSHSYGSFFDEESGVWTTVKTTGPSPGPRHTQGMTAVGHTLYLYGGYSSKVGWNTEFWSFDFSVLLGG